MSLSGKQSSEVRLPSHIDQASKDALAQAQQAAAIGYTPYYGPDVAAFSPMQQASFGSTNMAASAYGLPTGQGTGMPAPTTFSNGVSGYSSAPGFQAALAELQRQNPAQFNAIAGLFPGMFPGAGQQAQPSSSGLLSNAEQGGQKVYDTRSGQFVWDGKQFVKV